MKKVVTVLTFIFMMICISKVEAYSDTKTIDRTKENLENLVEIKVSEDEDTWEFINTDKYTAENMVMYKIGNEDASDSGTYIQYLTYNSKIKRIIKNGYGEKEASEYELNNENDLYLATKIALDCLENNIEPEKINEHYRANSLLSNDLKTRAENIISGAKKILEIGINGNETYYRNLAFSINGEIEKDNVKDNYYCQLYNLEIKGAGCDSCQIEDTGESSIDYVIANAETSEEQKDFTESENQFKILIPEENGHGDFTIKFKITANFLGENFYIGTDWSNKYIVFAKNEAEEKTLSTELHNRRSTLALNFIDEETEENIYGINVEVDGKSDFVSSYQNIVKTDIPESTVHVKVTSIPKDYEIEKTDYYIDIVYNEDHVETIKLKHKKGKVEVTTNAGEAEYEIYDTGYKKIIPHVIQEDGTIYIAQINTGKYKLKQISVNSQYELAKDIEFTIKHNETTKITVQNELKKVEEDEEEDRDEELEQEDKDTNPKEDRDDEKEKQDELDKENDNKENTQKEEDQKNNNKVEENKEQSKDEDKSKEEINDNEKQETEEKEEPEDKENEIVKEEQKPNLDKDNIDDNKEIEETAEEDTEEKSEEKLEENPEENSDNKNNDVQEDDEEPKDENNENNNSNTENLKEEESNESNQNKNIEKLPRTGDDYFIIKLIFMNLILFTFCIFILKIQTARKAKQSAYSKF